MNSKTYVSKGNGLYLVIILTYIALNLAMEFMVKELDFRFTYFQQILIAQIGYALPAIWYVCKQRQPLRESIRLRKVNFLTIVLLILFAFSIMPLMTLLNALSLLVSRNYIQSTVNGLLDQTNFFIGLLAIGVLPPLLEEFVYRGVIYNAHRKADVRKAILCSGLFFGLLHMNLNQFSYAFVMGAVLAVVVEATGTIVGPMIVHATINSYSIGMSKLQPYIMEKLAKAQGTSVDKLQNQVAVTSRKAILAGLPGYFIAAIIGTAISAGVLFLIVKYNNRDQEMKAVFTKQESSVRFVDAYFVVAVGIAVALMIQLS